MFKSFRQLHWSVYALAVASGVIMTGFMMLLPLLPRYADQLGFNEFEIGILVASFFLGRVLFEFPVGLLSDYVGRRLIMWAALLLFSVTTAAYALTTVAAIMILLRLLQGVASSAFAVGSQSYINDLTPAQYRGLANGVISSAVNIGVVAGPVLSGMLSQAYSIHTPFWIGGAMGAASLVFCLTIPSVGIRKKQMARQVSFKLSNLGHVLAPVFSLPPLFLSLVHFLQWVGIAIFLTIAPIFTAETLSWDANLVALAFAASGAVSALFSPLLGHLSDRSGRIWVIAAGLIVMALESLVVLLHPGTVLTIIAFALGGFGAPAYFNSFLSLVGDVTSTTERGAVTGFVGSFGEWGSILGSGLITPLMWHNINVHAPLVFDVVVFLLTTVLVLAVKNTLQRQVGRKV